MTTHRRGEIWLASLDPIVGHEQGGTRPCMVVSADAYNKLPIGMVIVVPLTTSDRGLAHQTPILGTATGLTDQSFARPEDVRAISAKRLLQRLGEASVEELQAVAATLRAFLDL